MRNYLLKHWIVLTVSLLVLGYGSLTGTLFWFVRFHRHHLAIEYADLALPWRWPNYHEKQGEYMLGYGLQLANSGKIEQAIFQTRKGLERVPASRNGRLLLAQLYASSRRLDLAQQALLEGLPIHSDDPTYVGALLQFLLDQEDDRQVISLSERLLAGRARSQALTRVAAMSAANACFFRGNYDRAERFLETPGVESAPAAGLLAARIEWERGYHELALMLLRSLTQQSPADEAIYAQLNDYLRTAGCRDEARQRAVLHQVAFPDRPRSAIDQLNALSDAGETDVLNQAARRMLRDFARDEAGLLALGDFAASHGLVPIALGVLDQFRLLNPAEATTPRLMVVESLLAAKRYAEALKQAQTLEAAGGMAGRYANVCIGLEAIAHYGLNDPVAGYTSLTTLLARPNLRPASLVAIARRLAAMDYPTPAREVLTHAVNLDARNQAALTQLIELELDTGQIDVLPQRLRALTKMRKPSLAVLHRAQRILRSDDYLFLPRRDEVLALLARTIEAQPK